MKKQKNLAKKQYTNYLISAQIFVLSGIIASFYSCYSHYRVYTDLAYSSFCALTKSVNCDTVAQSPWSTFIGIPMSWWGTVSFGSYLIFLPLSRQNWRNSLISWNILLTLGAIYSFASLLLGIISVTQIHAVCIICLLVYTCHLGLTYTSWLIRRRLVKVHNTNNQQRLPTKRIAVCLVGMLVALVTIKLFLPTYWQFTLSPPENRIKHGITENYHPWIGAEKPLLTIEEFSDYQCFQCAKMHFFLRKLIERYPKKIRLVHRNFPLDHSVNNIVTPAPFHVGSGKLAKLAIYAATKNKFWEMNDAIYALVREKNNSIPLKLLSKKTGLKLNELAWALQSKEIAELLRRDIWRGMKYGIIGTPGFVIEGKLYTGNIPATILKQALE